MSAPYDTNDALTGGQWVNDRGIMRWEPGPLPEVTPDAIVCPKCQATASQSCRTPNGRRSGEHAARTHPRTCRCGGELEFSKSVCAECRAEGRRIRQAIYLAKRKARTEREDAA